jgi:hypothetical protein
LNSSVAGSQMPYQAQGLYSGSYQAPSPNAVPYTAYQVAPTLSPYPGAQVSNPGGMGSDGIYNSGMGHGNGQQQQGMSTGEIAGITLGSITLLALFGGGLYYGLRSKKTDGGKTELEDQDDDKQTGSVGSTAPSPPPAAPAVPLTADQQYSRNYIKNYEDISQDLINLQNASEQLSYKKTPPADADQATKDAFAALKTKFLSDKAVLRAKIEAQRDQKNFGDEAKLNKVSTHIKAECADLMKLLEKITIMDSEPKAAYFGFGSKPEDADRPTLKTELNAKLAKWKKFGEYPNSAAYKAKLLADAEDPNNKEAHKYKGKPEHFDQEVAKIFIRG